MAGAALDFVGRPAALRADDKGRCRGCGGVHASDGHRGRGRAGLDQQEERRRQVGQRRRPLERLRLGDRRHRRAAALLRRRDGDPLPSLGRGRAPTRRARFGTRRDDRLNNRGDPIITASRTTSSILSPLSTACASVMATRGSGGGTARLQPRTHATSCRPVRRASNSPPRPLKTRSASPAFSRSTRVRCSASSSGSGTTSPGACASGA